VPIEPVDPRCLGAEIRRLQPESTRSSACRCWCSTMARSSPEIDRDLPAISRSLQPEPSLVRARCQGNRPASRCGTGGSSSIFLFPGLARVPQHPSGHEGAGGAASAGLGRGEQSRASPSSSACSTTSLKDKPFRGRRSLQPSPTSTGFIAVDFLKPAKLSVPPGMPQPFCAGMRTSRRDRARGPGPCG